VNTCFLGNQVKGHCNSNIEAVVNHRRGLICENIYSTILAENLLVIYTKSIVF